MFGWNVILLLAVYSQTLSLNYVDAACSDGELCLNGGICSLDGGREKCSCNQRFYGVVCSEYSSSFQLLFKNNAVPSIASLKPYFKEENIELASVRQTSIGGVYEFVFHTKLDSPKPITETFQKHTELATLNDNIVSIEDVDECDKNIGVTCPVNKVCKNVIGSFECQCKDGYETKGNGCVEKESSVWEGDGLVTWIIVIGVILLLLIAMISAFYVRRWYKNRKQYGGDANNGSDTTDGESVKVASEHNSYSNAKQGSEHSQHTSRHRIRSFEDRISVLSDPSYQYNRRYTPQYGPQSKISRSKSMRSTTNHARPYPKRNSRLPSNSSNIQFANRYYNDASMTNIYGGSSNYGYTPDTFGQRQDIATLAEGMRYSSGNFNDRRFYGYTDGFYEPSLQYTGIINEDPGITFDATNRYAPTYTPSFDAQRTPYSESHATYDMTASQQRDSNGQYLTGYQV